MIISEISDGGGDFSSGPVSIRKDRPQRVFIPLRDQQTRDQLGFGKIELGVDGGLVLQGMETRVFENGELRVHEKPKTALLDINHEGVKLIVGGETVIDNRAHD